MYFKRLEELRIDNDKTQQEIADYLNCKREVYRRYEKGEREIPVWALIKLAKLYKKSTDYILSGCVNNFVCLVENGSFLVRIRYEILSEESLYYGICKGTITTDYQRKRLIKCWRRLYFIER